MMTVEGSNNDMKPGLGGFSADVIVLIEEQLDLKSSMSFKLTCKYFNTVARWRPLLPAQAYDKYGNSTLSVHQQTEFGSRQVDRPIAFLAVVAAHLQLEQFDKDEGKIANRLICSDCGKSHLLEVYTDTQRARISRTCIPCGVRNPIRCFSALPEVQYYGSAVVICFSCYAPLPLDQMAKKDVVKALIGTYFEAHPDSHFCLGCTAALNRVEKKEFATVPPTEE